MSAIKDVKCVIVGDGAVGKTFFLTTVLTDKYPVDYVPRVFSDRQHDVELPDGRRACISFWDTGSYTIFVYGYTIKDRPDIVYTLQ